MKKLIQNVQWWEQLYQEEQSDQLPWYTASLDSDVEKAILQSRLAVHDGIKALDIGTGPGTQAVALSIMGFNVTATDISNTAIIKAAERAQSKGVQISVFQDNILESKITGVFDIILDRGVFHVIPPDLREVYLDRITALLGFNGMLLLKCFSEEQSGEDGPYRFSPKQLEDLFSNHLHVESIQRSVFSGTLDPEPKALFMIAKNTERDIA